MTGNYVRKAVESDLCRIAETEIFNYRLNFYPIFRNDEYSWKGKVTVMNGVNL